jgi:methionyl-tRNA synthetase
MSGIKLSRTFYLAKNLKLENLMSDPQADKPPVPQPAAPSPAPAAPAPAPAEALISIDEFHRVKLATGEVISAAAHPKADRLLVLQVKVGEQVKQIVSGIRQYYTPEQMVGKTIIVVNNLQPAKLRGVDSNGMLLAVSTPDGGLRLVTTDGPAPSGLNVT